MAQARDRLRRRQAIPLAHALASPSAEVDWSCEGETHRSKRVGVALGAVSRTAYEKTPQKYVDQKPTKRTILDAQFNVLKIDCL